MTPPYKLKQAALLIDSLTIEEVLQGTQKTLKAKIKAKQAAYYQRPEIKAKQAAYYQRPEIKAKRAAYYQRHAEELKAKQAAYRQRRKEETISEKRERIKRKYDILPPAKAEGFR